MTKAIIEERGNGFPDVGDYVPGDDGELYQVRALNTRIHTGAAAGAANYVYADLSRADWGDVESDDDVFPAAAVLTDDEPE